MMAVQWKNHIMWNPTIPPDQKFSYSLLQNFQVHVQANHREADITHQLISLEDLENDQAEDPPAENIIQLYTAGGDTSHGLGRLKRRTFTSY